MTNESQGNAIAASATSNITSIALVHDPDQGVKLTARVPPASLVKLKAAVMWLWTRLWPAVVGFLAGKAT